MERSLRQKILDYLIAWNKHDPSQFINGGELERLALGQGYKASNCSRRCRELADEGLLERRINTKGSVEYRYASTSLSTLTMLISKNGWSDRGVIEI